MYPRPYASHWGRVYIHALVSILRIGMESLQRILRPSRMSTDTTDLSQQKDVTIDIPPRDESKDAGRDRQGKIELKKEDLVPQPSPVETNR